jgi:hypothetical protein
MPPTNIAPGKTYTCRHGLLRAAGGVVAVRVPDGYNGCLNKESIFKIRSDDRRISCFLRFHDAATPLERGWISKPFPLEGQQMVAVGPAKTKNGAHSRRFEGGPYVAYKAEKRDASGNGISCSIAASNEHAAALTTFMRDLLDGTLFGDAPAAPAPAPAKPKPSRPEPVIPPGAGPSTRLLLTTLTENLTGKMLRLEESQRDSDYSGGGFFTKAERRCSCLPTARFATSSIRPAGFPAGACRNRRNATRPTTAPGKSACSTENRSWACSTRAARSSNGGTPHWAAAGIGNFSTTRRGIVFRSRTELRPAACGRRMHPRSVGSYSSPLMPAALMTGHHFSISAFW